MKKHRKMVFCNHFLGFYKELGETKTIQYVL